MSPIAEERSETVSLRVPRKTRLILQQAASIAGQSLTGFVVACCAEKACEIMERHHVATMKQEAYDEFATALDAPIRTVPPFAAAMIKEFAVSAREDGRFEW